MTPPVPDLNPSLDVLDRAIAEVPPDQIPAMVAGLAAHFLFQESFDSEGFWRRPLLIPFEQTFRGGVKAVKKFFSPVEPDGRASTGHRREPRRPLDLREEWRYGLPAKASDDTLQGATAAVA